MPAIVTNLAAIAANRYLNMNSSDEGRTIAQLASGQRIIRACDDAAGLALGTQLQAQTAVFKQDVTNMTQGMSILNTVDGALAQISNVLQRMMTLAATGASGQVTDAQRTEDLGTEYNQLKIEIGSIINTTTYANKSLLTGSFLSNIKFMVGTTSIAFLSMSIGVSSSVTLLGQHGLWIDTAARSLSAMAAVGSAISAVTKERALVGAYESQFSFSSESIKVNIESSQAAASVIMDADIAASKASLSSQDVLTQAAIAALTQANALPQQLLKLLQ